jgi:hypothetical protein
MESLLIRRLAASAVLASFVVATGHAAGLKARTTCNVEGECVGYVRWELSG